VQISYTTVTRERAVIIAVFWICIHIIQYWPVYFISRKTAEFTVLLFHYAKLIQWFKSFPLWQHRLCCILPTDNFPTSMSFENTVLITCTIPSNCYETVHIADGVHSCFCVMSRIQSYCNCPWTINRLLFSGGDVVFSVSFQPAECWQDS
jgi:hypothetical protein